MNADAIIECVPNFSDGINSDCIAEIITSMHLDGVRLLDWSRDSDHNRSVITIAGTAVSVVEAAIRSVGVAASRIDLTRQTGVHPRIGAADVIPFVPVSGISLAECAMMARQAGLQIWRRFGVPVYFYGAAASRPDRLELENVRRGQFEGLREASLRDSSRRPDVGGPELHASAGATAVGARSFLIAYNVYLAHPDVAIARAIARDLRSSSGGLPGVKALGVMVQGRAQVSTNITDFHRTPMRSVFAAAEQLAHQHGTSVIEGELVGLIPEAAYDSESEWSKQIPAFRPDEKILERKLHRPLPWPMP